MVCSQDINFCYLNIICHISSAFGYGRSHGDSISHILRGMNPFYINTYLYETQSRINIYISALQILLKDLEHSLDTDWFTVYKVRPIL